MTLHIFLKLPWPMISVLSSTGQLGRLLLSPWIGCMLMYFAVLGRNTARNFSTKQVRIAFSALVLKTGTGTACYFQMTASRLSLMKTPQCSLVWACWRRDSQGRTVEGQALGCLHLMKSMVSSTQRLKMFSSPNWLRLMCSNSRAGRASRLVLSCSTSILSIFLMFLWGSCTDLLTQERRYCRAEMNLRLESLLEQFSRMVTINRVKNDEDCQGEVQARQKTRH